MVKKKRDVFAKLGRSRSITPEVFVCFRLACQRQSVPCQESWSDWTLAESGGINVQGVYWDRKS